MDTQNDLTDNVDLPSISVQVGTDNLLLAFGAIAKKQGAYFQEKNHRGVHNIRGGPTIRLRAQAGSWKHIQVTNYRTCKVNSIKMLISSK